METVGARAKAVREYCALLEEVKLRLDAIDATLNEETKLHRVFAQEFCFLQIRMICELIALACLSAHEDLADASKLKKQWSADQILVALESLQPHFFPWPSQQSRDPQTKKLRIEDVDNKADCITKEELLKLYGLCGNYVHRGTYRNIFDVKRIRLVPYKEIHAHCQRIVNLLASHSVLTKRGGKFYLMFCVMNADPDGKVKAVVAYEMDEKPPQ